MNAIYQLGEVLFSMSESKRAKAAEVISRAKIALKDGDLEEVRRNIDLALYLDPGNEESYLILAAICDPLESIEHLNKALEINPDSPRARKGMLWAAKRLREHQNHKAEKELRESQKKRAEKKKSRWRGLSFFFLLISFGGLILYWLSLPAPGAEAAVHNVSRPKNALVKPTLTPTMTPTPTVTPTPTPTRTPTPVPVADTSYGAYYYHSWDIPEEVSGANDFWIEVDLSAQMLFAYRGDQIINSFLVSTGTQDHPTVTGAYKIYAKHYTYTMVGPGYNLPDVPYSLFFHKGYSIHGTYWHSNFGTPMSHGCVNMNTADAAWIYDQAVIGTYVFVHY